MGSTLNKRFLLVAPIFALLQGCEAPEAMTVQVGNSAVIVDPVLPPEVPYNPNAVCDPFSSGGGVGGDYGLLASLYYVPADVRHYTMVQEYQVHGTRLNADLFFNQLNVPTRPFDLGFMTQAGQILLTPSGDTLYEYFALHFDSVLRLTDRQQPGRYQFAVLADDGAVFSVNDNGTGYRKLVDNDGLHATRMKCSSEAISLDYNSRLPIQMDYYQGPRYHIALMLMWRKVADVNPDLSDVACGVTGNDAFFDSTKTPSAPQQRYKDMLTRGWRVVGADNYLLPGGSGGNPCAGGAPIPTN